MEELCLHIIDMVQNSVRAGAKNIEVIIKEDTQKDILSIEVIDDGEGMTEDMIEKIQSPFFSTKEGRKVGLGIPLLKAAALHCEGDFKIESEPGKGTKIFASFKRSHIDLPPLGNLEDTILTLITTIQDVDFRFVYQKDRDCFELETKKIKELLGDLPLSHPEVIKFLREYIKENLEKMMEVKNEA